MQNPNHIAAPRSHRPIRFGAMFIAVGLIAAACSGGSDTQTIKLGEQPLAPAIEDVQPDTPEGLNLDIAFDTFDGQVGNLGAFVGRPLVVNFFAAWCPTCISEMPDFEAVHQQLGDSVAIVGLSIDADARDALELIDQTGITYDTGWDPRTTAYIEFGGFAMPTTVFIDSSGEVVEVFSGGLNVDALLDKIDQIT